jgi:hypothetical protein
LLVCIAFHIMISKQLEAMLKGCTRAQTPWFLQREPSTEGRRKSFATIPGFKENSQAPSVCCCFDSSHSIAAIKHRWARLAQSTRWPCGWHTYGDRKPRRHPR